MNFAHVDLEVLLPWCPPSPLPHTVSTLSLPWDFLNSEGKDLMDIYHLRLNVPRVLNIAVMFDCGYLYLFLSAAG